jgi:hypothetical protein
MVMSKFGNMVTARRMMVPLPNGYVLKGHFRRGVRQFARTKLHRDTAAGSQMTYPALSLSMRPQHDRRAIRRRLQSGCEKELKNSTKREVQSWNNTIRSPSSP